MGSTPKQAPLIVIVGETASGKSALALELAGKFNGEIICADSRTVYAGLDIGTAKSSKEQQERLKHHLLDIATLDQNFTVADFKREALKVIEDIASRGKLPIMVGGTGLYIDAVLFDYDFAGSSERDSDNPRHAKIPGSHGEMRQDTLVIGLRVEKEQLDERITRRVDHMFELGLDTEVKQLVDRYGWDASGLQTIGYQELKDYFAGEQNLEETRQQIEQATRQYAKRQRTWFKRNKSIHWLAEPTDATQLVQNFLSKVSRPA